MRSEEKRRRRKMTGGVFLFGAESLRSGLGGRENEQFRAALGRTSKSPASVLQNIAVFAPSRDLN
jgi:hypothetical protein